MWRPPSIVAPHTALSSLGPAVKVNNYYDGLVATSRDRRAAKTISVIIKSLHDQGHQGPVEQGFIGNRLHGSGVSQFLRARHGSLVKFLTDGTCRDDFTVLVGKKGTCFVDRTPAAVLRTPVRASPADSMSLRMSLDYTKTARAGAQTSAEVFDLYSLRIQKYKY